MRGAFTAIHSPVSRSRVTSSCYVLPLPALERCWLPMHGSRSPAIDRDAVTLYRRTIAANVSLIVSIAIGCLRTSRCSLSRINSQRLLSMSVIHCQSTAETIAWKCQDWLYQICERYLSSFLWREKRDRASRYLHRGSNDSTNGDDSWIRSRYVLDALPDLSRLIHNFIIQDDTLGKFTREWNMTECNSLEAA